MKSIKTIKKVGSMMNLSEDEIDNIVIAQADDEDAWEPAIEVNPKQSETEYLLSSKANREHLMKSIKDHREGKFESHDLLD
jgi:hypothetical protein